MIDKTLNFDDHINKVSTKVSQSIAVIIRVFNMMPDIVLHSLYYALIYSRITQAICTWVCSSYCLKRFKYLVKKALTMQSVPPYRPDLSFLQYVEAYRYFILCKLLKV